ncbi:ATP-dependent Clp protease ATP-binding subunit ClpX [Anaerosacchariphilus polymeriproducens]|uniref:ATP-dependent Clp protease ATP-binding subunit ClpX n=2 Tax=Anaerosacchariphilus polymeriproducens TaxID=1812858 RepID=A0A371ARF5_9FIRM|nr:ATP-dependent Clp protease ATP-binding subunit ClpX [Anaerosacchariphilus polymeriproducens]RDU22151.1 ATP-dependent Clp protease ATP-binding subunit ClpX [Anaerosacchariphilus polymeriproducens]
MTDFNNENENSSKENLENIQLEKYDMDKKEDKTGDTDEYEEFCYICRRPESKVGKLIKIPNNIKICAECMQKTFDTMNHTDINFDDMVNLSNLSNMPNISMINLSDLQNMIPRNKKIKKKKSKEEKKVTAFDIKSIPAPHKIKAQLDEYVVGQDYAKRVMSVAVYNHYKRVAVETMDDIEIEKSNMLMIGPTGCGKTYLVKTLAKLLDVPLAITDATSLTEAGYIGDDIESVVSKLLAAADNDVEKAEHGIIFIDEIDKIAKKKNTNQRDVSGESVQQGMLKLLEGSEIEVPVGANSKNAMVPLTTVNTKNILFICGGAFPDLDEIIKERLNKQSSMGFKADLKDKYDNDRNLLHKVTVEDIKNFGMIPEFLGRLPIVFSLDGLTEEMYVKILKEPKNAILKQYRKLLELDEVQLIFEDEALHAIARKAMEKKTGARALRAIIEDFMLDIMYEIPKDDNIGRVTITKDYIEKTGGPMITMRGCLELEENNSNIIQQQGLAIQ